MCSHKTNDILSRWRDTDGIILEEVLPGCSSWDEEGKARRVLQIRQPETHGIAGMLSSLVASRVTRRVGCQGVMFLAGSVINAAAVNIAMLIIGRILLGFGVGFTAQV
jgi:hypothetical protein